MLCWVWTALGGAVHLSAVLQSLTRESGKSWFSHLNSCSKGRSEYILLNLHYVCSHATCMLFVWINLPVPTFALQFLLCLSSYMVFLVMPQKPCSHLLSKPFCSIAGHMTTNTRSCAGASGLIPHLASKIYLQHVHRPPTLMQNSMACSFQKSHQNSQENSDFSLPAA